MNTQRTAARLRALARQLILEAESLEAIAAPQRKSTSKAEFEKLRPITKKGASK